MKKLIPILLIFLVSCASSKKYGCGLTNTNKQNVIRSNGQVTIIDTNLTLIRINGAAIKNDTDLISNIKFVLVKGEFNKQLQKLNNKQISFELYNYKQSIDEICETTSGCIENSN